MNLSKAIELKELDGEEFIHADPDELDEANRLSIEALKDIEHMRLRGVVDKRHRLIGETEE